VSCLDICLLYILVLLSCLLHQGFIVEQFESVHFLSILFGLLLCHLCEQDVLVLLVDVADVVSLLLFVLFEVGQLN
jgi:hypothetical protein